MKTITINLYTIEEMKEQFPKVYQHILDNNRDFNTGDDWYTFVYDYFREPLEKIGFTDIEFSFSGFWSQGDGASFTAKFSAPASFPELKETETLETVRALAGTLQIIAGRFPGLSFAITRDDRRYSHENTVSIDELTTWPRESIDADGIGDAPDYWERLKEIEDAARDVMRELYRSLEKDYEALTSDENVHDCLSANGYFFDLDGKIRG